MPSNQDNLKSLIKEIIDEVIEEMTSTGAVAGYNTPAAFRGHASKKKAAERSMPGGKVVDDESEADDTTIGETNERLPMVRRGGEVMEEGRGRYRNFKDSDLMKNHAKISYGIREAKKILREVDFLVGICERLKTEGGIPTDSLWKRTQPDLKEIHSQLKEIAKRLNRIGKR